MTVPMFMYGRLVIGCSLPLNYADRIDRTGGQAVAKSITVVITDQGGLAIDKGDRPFVTGFHAKATAITARTIYLDNLAYHHFLQMAPV